MREEERRIGEPPYDAWILFGLVPRTLCDDGAISEPKEKSLQKPPFFAGISSFMLRCRNRSGIERIPANRG